MSRKADVKALLDAVTEQHTAIKKKYDEALKNKSLDLRVPVKNLMENLRSALDYMAHDVYEAKCQPVRAAAGKADPRNIYFPYGKTAADFFSGVQSSLPELKTVSVDIYNILESVQPYKTGNNELHP